MISMVLMNVEVKPVSFELRDPLIRKRTEKGGRIQPPNKNISYRV